jgi:hypothetical protein
MIRMDIDLGGAGFMWLAGFIMGAAVVGLVWAVSHSLA